MNLYGVENAEQYLPEGFFEDVAAAMAKRRWQQLLDDSVNPEVFRIHMWREDHPGEDPLRAHALMAELRDLYHQIPACSVKLQYVNNLASELGITVRDVETLLGATESADSATTEMPPVKGIKGTYDE